MEYKFWLQCVLCLTPTTATKKNDKKYVSVITINQILGKVKSQSVACIKHASYNGYVPHNCSVMKSHQRKNIKILIATFAKWNLISRSYQSFKNVAVHRLKLNSETIFEVNILNRICRCTTWKHFKNNFSIRQQSKSWTFQKLPITLNYVKTYETQILFKSLIF